MTTKDDKPEAEQAAAEAKERAEQALVDEAKGLLKTGFGREQVAQQLSAKHTMTVDAVTAILDRDLPPDEAKSAG